MKFSKNFLLPVMLFLSVALLGQSFNMDGTPITSCVGYFHDSGGADANYGLNENFTTTICSNGGSGTHIQLIFSGIDIGPGEIFNIYDAATADIAFQFDSGFLLTPNNSFIIQATAANPSGCITIEFTSDNIDEGNNGWNASISCIPSCQTIEALLVNATPAVSPVDTGWIDICPGDEVFFEGSANFPQNNVSYIQDNSLSIFEWDFGDGTREVGMNASHVYNQAGGYIVQLTVTDQMGCTNTNFLNQRVRVSTYPTFELNSIQDPTICTSDTITISSGVDTMILSDLLVRANQGNFNPPGFRTDTIKLPDGVGTSYESSFYFTQFPAGAVLENPEDLLGVLLNMEHSYYGDLSIELICPDGTSLTILDNTIPPPAGLGTTNLGEPWAGAPVDPFSSDCTKGCGYDYKFVNSSPNGTLRDVVSTLSTSLLTTKPSEESGVIHQYLDRTFPAGEYQSDNPFSALVGCPLNGQWIIKVTDHLNQDNGWLFGWELCFSPDLFTNIETFTPVYTTFDWEANPTVLMSSPTALSASPMNPGVAEYTYFVVDTFGCQYDTTLIYEVLPLSHPDCLECDIEVNQPADLLVCSGEVVPIDVSPVNSLENCVEFKQYPQYAIGAANHSATSPYASTFTVNSINPGIINTPTIDICSVCINLSTDELADISLVLEAPNGAQLLLSSMNGGTSSAGYVETCFTPTSLMQLSGAAPPYTGAFQPDDPMGWSSIVGSPINGVWTLWVVDCCDLTQMGELIDWSISFNNVQTYDYNWTASPDLSCMTCPGPFLTANTSGNQILEITDNFGCVYNDTIAVQIIEDLDVPVVICTPENNGILFEWTAQPIIDSFEYRITVNGMVQNWVGPINEQMLFYDLGLSHNDEVTIEVRAYLPDPSASCEPIAGTSTCEAEICDIVLDNPTVNDASCFDVTDGAITINVQSGTMPYTYQISDDPTIYDTPTISGLAAGSYTYTVINGDGCDRSEGFTIGSPDSLFVDGLQTFASCYGLDENEAMATAGGGSGAGYTITWSNAGTGATQTMLASNDYQISVVDGAGCMATSTLTISSLDSIMFNFLTNPPTCNGLDDGGVGINQISGGAGLTDADYEYVWEDGSTEIVRTSLFGDMEYCVTVTDNQGCMADFCRLLPQPELDTVILVGTPPSCAGDQDGQVEIVSPSPLDNYMIVWSANTGGQTTETATNLPAAFYSVSLTDQDGCVSENSLSLVDNLVLTTTYELQDNECFGYNNGSIQVTAAGGMAPYSYQWSHSAPDTSLVSNLAAGDYEVTITDDNGCSITEFFTIKEPIEVSVEITANPTTCFGDRDGSIELMVTGGSPPFQYSLNGGLFIGTSVIVGLEAGAYSVQIKDDNDCRFFTMAEVEQPDEFIIDAGPDLSINFGESVVLTSTPLNAQGNISYLWKEPFDGTLSCLDCPEPSASPEYTVDYQLLAIDSAGCEAEDQLRVFVEKNYVIEVPTGFTPNGDFVNDRLLVHGTPGVQIVSFQVFDRWGEEVFIAQDFEVNNTGIGWDGTFRGETYNSGVFVWQLEVLLPDGKEERLSGQTTLIR